MLHLPHSNGPLLTLKTKKILHSRHVVMSLYVLQKTELKRMFIFARPVGVRTSPHGCRVGSGNADPTTQVRYLSCCYL